MKTESKVITISYLFKHILYSTFFSNCASVILLYFGKSNRVGYENNLGRNSLIIRNTYKIKILGVKKNLMISYYRIFTQVRRV